MSEEVYGFGSQNDINRISDSVNKTEKLFTRGGDAFGKSSLPYFAKITSLEPSTEDKRAKGVQVIYDRSLLKYVEPSGDALIFDNTDTSLLGTGDIYSDTAMVIDQVVQVSRYTDSSLPVDQADLLQWIVPKSGGGDRPTIITSGSTFANGAKVLSPDNLTAIKEFDVGEFEFKAILPWGDLIDLPDDFLFIGDLISGVYYTDSYPKTIWAKPLETYPDSGGITSYDILDSRSENGIVLDTGISGRELVLQDFDNSTASLTSRAYFSGKYFACSYNYSDDTYYFDHPIFGV